MLAELASLARDCAKSTTRPERAVAFALSKLAGSLAHDLDERPVRKAEADEIVRAIHQPVLKAIEFLNGARDIGEPLELIAALIDRELDLTP